MVRWLKTLPVLLLLAFFGTACVKKDSKVGSLKGDAEGYTGFVEKVLSSGEGNNYFQVEPGYTCNHNGQEVKSFKSVYHSSEKFGTLLLGDLCSDVANKATENPESFTSGNLSVLGLPTTAGIFEYKKVPLLDKKSLEDAQNGYIEAWCKPTNPDWTALNEFALRSKPGLSLLPTEGITRTYFIKNFKIVGDNEGSRVAQDFALFGDITGNGIVDAEDIGYLQDDLGKTGPDLKSDLNHDGIVDDKDAVLLEEAQYGLKLSIDFSIETPDHKYYASIGSNPDGKNVFLCRVVR